MAPGARRYILQELRNTLRPEFLNRIDEIVIFPPRGQADGVRRAAAQADDPAPGIQDPLALRLLEGEFKDGDTITVDAEGDALAFKRDATVRR